MEARALHVCEIFGGYRTVVSHNRSLHLCAVWPRMRLMLLRSCVVTVLEGRKVQVVVASYLVLRRVIIISVGEVEI